MTRDELKLRHSALLAARYNRAQSAAFAGMIASGLNAPLVLPY